MSVEISSTEGNEVVLTFEGVEQGGREGGREGGEEQWLWLRYAFRNNVCPDRVVSGGREGGREGGRIGLGDPLLHLLYSLALPPFLAPSLPPSLPPSLTGH